MTLSFQVPDTIPLGPSYWKLNTSVLDEPDYRELITSLWRGWQSRRSEYDSPLIWWDLGKIKIRDIQMRYCKARACKRRSERQSLLDELVSLRSQFELGRTSVLTRMKQVESELRAFDLEQARAAQVRARALGGRGRVLVFLLPASGEDS